MNAEIRLRLDMLSRVQGFCRAHPSDEAGTIGLVARLDERLARAIALNHQAASGHLTAHASVVTKDDLKLRVRDNFWVLEGLADLVAMDQPGLNARFQVPAITDGHWAFLTASRVALAHATPFRDVFLSHGMSATFLEDLTALVDRYEKTVDDKVAATSAQVGAHADLDAVMEELMLIVHLLDKIFRVRFRNEAESLAAWKSARDVAWPTASKDEPPPSGGAVEPAA